MEPGSASSKFRKDVFGLRGIAVLFVVLGHFGFPGLANGFIGVDLFFVISGYLIVGLLYQEYVKNGRSLGGYGWISIWSFYERRARRVLPAAFFVLGAIYSTSLLLEDSNAKSQIFRDVIWAFLFGSNINFAQKETDYFAQNALPSPVLHYWSLAVEEQYYLIMPFLFMAIVNWHGFSIAGKRFAARRRLFVVMGALSLISCGSMAILFSSNQFVIYFSLFTRMWEFGLGALTALLLPVATRQAQIFLILLRRAAYFLLVLSLVIVTSTNFGYTLIFPTSATAVILYTNNQIRGGFVYRNILTNSFLMFFGKISYSLYLWHWPAFIFAEYFGFSLTILHKLELFLVLILVSAFSERYIERPFLRAGFISEFHISQILKSRRITGITALSLAGFVFVATYQPVLSTQFAEIQSQRQQPFWSPPKSITDLPKNETNQQQPLTTQTPRPQLAAKQVLGIFGDSTNTCCSEIGAFWPGLVAKNFGWTSVDFSKPATSYLIDGVGSNGCTRASDCPSVVGQLNQAKNRKLDHIIISAGVGDCKKAQNEPSTLADSLTTLFQNFKLAFPSTSITAIGLVAPRTPSRNECATTINPIIGQAAKDSGINFVGNNLSWVPTTKVYWTTDYAHLTTAGHQAYAKKFTSWMKSQLATNSN